VDIYTLDKSEIENQIKSNLVWDWDCLQTIRSKKNEKYSNVVWAPCGYIEVLHNHMTSAMLDGRNNKIF
jgi:hypothetical protein